MSMTRDIFLKRISKRFQIYDHYYRIVKQLQRVKIQFKYTLLTTLAPNY